MKIVIKSMVLSFVCLATTLSAATFSNQLNTPSVGADPFILKHAGVYYLYCTAESALTEIGIPVYTSTNLVDWIGPCGAGPSGLALHEDDVWGDADFWAGDVVETNGLFYMYATANEHLIVAVSTSPLGPFTQTVQAPMHAAINEIDGSIFVDDNGKHYLYFVRYESGNVLYAAELSADMLTMKEETITLCLSAQAGTWENVGGGTPIIEGADALKHNGLYYLLYTANPTTTIDYSMGYATSTTPLGPWARYSANPIIQSTASVHGPGNGMVVNSPDDSEMYLVYHTHYDLNNVGPRRVSLDLAWFEANPLGGADIFKVDGPTVAPQDYPSGGVPSAPSSIAYWRVEEGTATNFQSDFYMDQSGNGNHLATWSIETTPDGSTDRPFTTVPQTGAANIAALHFVGGDDLYTAGKMIETYSFDSGWTVEASFKADSAHWGVIVGKDGDTGGPPPFSMKFRADNFLEVGFWDQNASAVQFFGTSSTLNIGEWYSVAVTFDGATANLYLKGESDAEYILVGQKTDALGGNLHPFHSTWTVGRGQWNGANTDPFQGYIDEVRISNSALGTNDFLATFVAFPPPLIGTITMNLLNANALTLTWTTAEGYNYAIETKPDLLSGWAVSTNVPGEIGSVTVTTAVDQVQAFYRVTGE